MGVCAARVLRSLEAQQNFQLLRAARVANFADNLLSRQPTTTDHNKYV